LLATRLHVVAARRVKTVVALTVRGRRRAVAARPAADPPRGSITVSLTIHGRSDAVEERLLPQAETELVKFLGPLVGGPDRRGWPFGRFVHLSEIYDILARLPEVDYVTPTKDVKPFLPVDSRRIVAGELPAIALDPDELPEAEIPTGDIKVTSETA
jgi:hypothetical protein